MDAGVERRLEQAAEDARSRPDAALPPASIQASAACARRGSTTYVPVGESAQGVVRTRLAAKSVAGVMPGD